LSAFTSIITTAASRLPSNAKVLVFSRPESFILDQLHSAAPFIVRSDLLTEESREDVRLFLEAELRRISELYGLKDWPQPGQIEGLCDHAAGHLGWAALAARWIGREAEQMGDTRYIRETVFDDVKEVRRGNVYDLYGFILSRVVPDAVPEHYLHGCQITMGCLAVLREPQTILVIAQLVHLEDNFNVLHFFKRISSIIANGLDVISSTTVPRPHKAFFDYLLSKHPEPRFQLHAPSHHERMATTCLNVVNSSLHFNMYEITTSDFFTLPKAALEDGDFYADLWVLKQHFQSRLDPYVLYTCTALLSHVRHAEWPLAQGIASTMFIFAANFLLYWLEVVCFDVIYDSNDLKMISDNLPVCASRGPITFFLLMSMI
jgi:hypothetical protein